MNGLLALSGFLLAFSCIQLCVAVGNCEARIKALEDRLKDK